MRGEVRNECVVHGSRQTGEKGSSIAVSKYDLQLKTTTKATYTSY
jgi:hypothetical protein